MLGTRSRNTGKTKELGTSFVTFKIVPLGGRQVNLDDLFLGVVGQLDRVGSLAPGEVGGRLLRLQVLAEVFGVFGN